MKADEYCIRVCGGKCCYLHTPWGEGPIKCPKLAEDNSCSVYHKRYGELAEEKLVIVGQWKSKVRKDIDGEGLTYPFYCGRVEEIIASGAMPKDVMDQCCYAHPELLEVEDQ